MSQNYGDQEISDIYKHFNAIDYRSKHAFIRAYKKKMIKYGPNHVTYTYNRPRVIFSCPKEYKPKPMKTERGQSSFNRAKQNLIRLIACNADSSPELPTFWTFTFDVSRFGNVTDLKIANNYFGEFRRKLTDKLKFKAKYIAVPEFHKNGNIHYHVVFFNLPFIPTHMEVFEKHPHLLTKKIYDFAMNDIWVYGFTDVILLTGVKNISLYLSKYMSKSFDLKTGNRTYGQKLYFASRGLKKPEVYYHAPNIDPHFERHYFKKISKIEWVAYGLIIKHLIRKSLNNNQKGC